MPRAKRESDQIEMEAPSAPFVPVRIKIYKTQTSQGRGIAGQLMELPADEAANLIAQGHASAI